MLPKCDSFQMGEVNCFSKPIGELWNKCIHLVVLSTTIFVGWLTYVLIIFIVNNVDFLS